MKRSSIIFASHAANMIGGAERSLFELIIDTKSRGYTPILVVPADGELSQTARQADVDCRVVPYGWWASPMGETPHLTGPNFDVSPIPQLVKLLGETKPFVAVSNTSVIPWMAYACAIVGVRHAWIIRELGQKDHGLHFIDGDQQVYKLIDLLSDVIFANSASVQNHLLSQIPSRNNIPILYPVVQPVSNALKNTPLSNPIRIVAVGQIKPSKGQFDAIKAVALLRHEGFDCRIDIVGDIGDVAYKKQLDEYVEKNQLEDYVTFTGRKQTPYVSKEPYHIAVVCSRFEAFGRVTVEAMLRNLPVVGANSGGTAEIITHLKTGLLYEAENPDSLAKEITRLINEPQLSQKLSKAALDHVKKTFSRQAAHRPFFDYLQSIDAASTPPANLASLGGLISDYSQLCQSHKTIGEIYDTMMKQSELLKEKNDAINEQNETIRRLSDKPLNRIISTLSKGHTKNE